MLANLCMDGEEGVQRLNDICRVLRSESAEGKHEMGHLLAAIGMLSPLVAGHATRVVSLDELNASSWTVNLKKAKGGKTPFDKDNNKANILGISGFSNIVIALGECPEKDYATFSVIMDHLNQCTTYATSPMPPRPENIADAERTPYVCGSGEHGDKLKTGSEHPLIQFLLLQSRRADKANGHFQTHMSSELVLRNFLISNNDVYPLSAVLGKNKMPDTLLSLVQGSGAIDSANVHGQYSCFTEGFTWKGVTELVLKIRGRYIVPDSSDDDVDNTSVKPATKAKKSAPAAPAKRATPSEKGLPVHAPIIALALTTTNVNACIIR